MWSGGGRAEEVREAIGLDIAPEERGVGPIRGHDPGLHANLRDRQAVARRVEDDRCGSGRGKRLQERGENAELGRVAVKRRANRFGSGGIGVAIERAALGVELVDRHAGAVVNHYILDELGVGAIELGNHDVERGLPRPGRNGEYDNLHRVSTDIVDRTAGQDGRGWIIEHVDVEIVGRAGTPGADRGERRVPLEGYWDPKALGNRDALENIFDT